MLARIKDWLGRAEAADGEGPKASGQELEEATALMLVEAASLDGDFDEDEAATIRNLLTERFHLSPDDAAEMLEQATAKADEAVELYTASRTVKEHMGPEDRHQILEMLWEVALADGVVHDYEANLVRRVAGLLHVPDRESGMARRRVESRLEQQNGTA